MTTKDTDVKAYDILEEVADELTDLIVRLSGGEVREALVELSQKVDDFLVDSEVGIVEDEPQVDDYDDDDYGLAGVPVAGLTPEQIEQIEDDEDEDYDSEFDDDEDDDYDEGVL